MTTRSGFRYLEPMRVRWAEVDMQKIVFNAHYLMYFDTAVAGWWRALALPYHETVEQLGGDFYVRKATIEYEGSARYDDRCDVGIRCGRIGKSSLLIEAALFRGAQRLVHGELVYVWADPATQTSRPVPQALRDWFEAHEAGEPMLNLRVAGWPEIAAEAQALRQAIFVEEQGLPAWLMSDPDDERAVHVLARNRLGLAVATRRALPLADGVVRLGRLAVMASLRGSGIGAALVGRLIEAAREQGAREAVLAAAEDAVPFYRRLGFVPRGQAFEEAGAPHQEMALILRG